MTVHASSLPNLQAVAFATPDNGWLATSDSILGTSDGGTHFHVEYRGSGTFSYIKPLNPRVVFAWGATQIARTTDGGLHWRIIKAPPGPSIAHAVYLVSLNFVSPQTGFALVGNTYNQPANPAKLYITRSAGASWNTLPPIPRDAFAAGFANAQDGFLITGSTHGGFFRTTDGGLHWTQSAQRLPDWFNLAAATLYVTGPDSAYAQVIGQGGMSQSSSSLFRTQNGIHWTPVLAVPTGGGGPAPGVGPYLYGNTVSSSPHTAKSPQGVPLGPGYDAGPVAVVNQNLVRVAGGMEATGIGVARIAGTNDAGAHWRTYPIVPGANGIPVFDNLSFVNANDGWLLMTQNSRAVLLRTTSGGATWHQTYPAPTVWPVLGATFVTSHAGYGLGVVGDVNAVLRTKNGGHTWAEIAHLPVKKNAPYLGPFFGQGISFANATTGWAVGGDGKLYASRNAGQTWHLLNTPAAAGPVVSVLVQSAGRKGLIRTAQTTYFTTDAGKTWITAGPASSPTAWVTGLQHIAPGAFSNGLRLLGTTPYPTIAGSHDQTLWMNGMVAYQGFLVSHDSGSHWTPYMFDQYTNISPASLEFTSATQGFMWTQGARLFATQDGGRDWTQIQ